MKTKELAFGLQRTNLMLDPILDAQTFINRDELRKAIESKINRSLATGTIAPLVIWGLYGSGKTHTLMYLANYIGKKRPNSGIHYVRCPVLYRKSNFTSLYKAIISAMGRKSVSKLISSFLREHVTGKVDLKKYPDKIISVVDRITQHRDLASIILAYEGGSPDIQLLIWKWFIGDKCSGMEKSRLGVLQDNSTPDGAIKTLVSLIRMHYFVKKSPTVLLLDEMEHLLSVREEEEATFLECFRILLEERKGLVIVFSVSGETFVDIPLFSHSVLESRIGTYNIIEIGPMPIKESREFIRQLLKTMRTKGLNFEKLASESSKLTDETVTPSFYPFTLEAIEKILAKEPYMVPRTLCMYLTHALGEAIIKGSKLVTSKIVEEVVR